MSALSLTAGSRLGPYEIEALLGSGGMGEVYRARDTRLNRIVAIKVLPGNVSSDTLRRERLDREALVISRLNHPHVRAIYDVGAHNGSAFLVMEYLEGESLESRLAKRPLAPNQAITYAVQIADALDAAHHQGIVHGDVKPANIMLTATGAKLLDFGVAQLRKDLVSADGERRQATTLSSGSSVPGTTAYMAPEQLEGAEPDPRSDIFALGVLLYEMLSGRRPFDAPTRARLIASILEHEPSQVSSPVEPLPAPLVRAVMKALAKDPDARWQTARDLASELRWIAQASPVAAAAATQRGRFGRRAWLLAALAIALAVLAGRYTARPTPAPDTDREVVRFLAEPPTGSSITVSPGAFAVSPDGRRLAFIAAAGSGTRQLWLRSFDSFETRGLDGTDDAWNPFWAPDSNAIAFFAGGQIRRIDLRTNIVQAIADFGATGFGGWSSNGTIVLASGGTLMRVSAGEGKPSRLTLPDVLNGATVTGVDFLPDGQHFLYHARARSPDVSGLYLGSLDAPADHRRLVAADSQALYSPGYLLYLRGGVLVAQPFDATRLAVDGEPRPLSEPVASVQGINRAVFSMSRGNVLAYRARISSSELLWFDRSGRPLGSLITAGPYVNPALSPDAARVAVTRFDPAAATANIWVVDANRAARQLTADAAVNDFPVWSPDGRRLLFTSQRDGVVRLAIKDVNAGGADPAATVVETPDAKIALDWTRDGRFALFTAFPGLGALGARFKVTPASAAQSSFELQTEAPVKEEGQGQISPDGRWLAYVYDVNGSPQVFVRPFPRGPGRWLIGSGFEPKWRGDGQELFYLAPDQMLMSVPVRTGTAFDAGDPRPLFRTTLVGAYLGAPFPSARVRNEYAVTRDGQRFLINQPVGGSAAYAVRVLVNWRQLLTAR